MQRRRDDDTLSSGGHGGHSAVQSEFSCLPRLLRHGGFDQSVFPIGGEEPPWLPNSVFQFARPGRHPSDSATAGKINNLFTSQCVYELLVALHASSAFLTSVPFHLVGFGNGGNLATCLAIQYGRYWPTLKSIVLVNSFAKIDTQLAGILHGALNLFSCLPPNRPDLPLSYFSKFLFSDSYLARVDPNLALSIYTAVTNTISLEGRIRICKGALHHVDLVSQLREVAVPLIVVQSWSPQRTWIRSWKVRSQESNLMELICCVLWDE
jgi:hypothetical protein